MKEEMKRRVLLLGIHFLSFNKKERTCGKKEGF